MSLVIYKILYFFAPMSFPEVGRFHFHSIQRYPRLSQDDQACHRSEVVPFYAKPPKECGKTKPAASMMRKLKTY